MIFFEILKSAYRNLVARKLRSFLTMLGMIIGIASVIIIVSIGASAQGLILDQVKSLGSNLIGILPGASDENGPPASALGVTVTTLTYDDAVALDDHANVPYGISVAAYVKGTDTISWQSHSEDTTITGTTASYTNVESADVESGRFFDETEEKGISRVVVLGSTVATDLFEDQNPVGQIVKIKRENFTVIGVMKKRGAAFFQNQDTQVFVPLSTAQKLLLGVNHLGFARVKVSDGIYVDQTINDIKATLRERHNIKDPSQDDFSVRSIQQAVAALTGITNALKFFLAAIAAIALLVGGIGIMNIMLVSVNERIREIGLRKAVGATAANIILQFLVETIFISLLGGGIGVSFGALISGIVALIANSLGYSWQFVVTLDSILIAGGVSIGIGLLFGIYPAIKAAKLDPIEALRYE